MERCGVDIQRLILNYITQGCVSRLYRLVRVNRLFRNWVMRFTADTVNKDKFHGRLSGCYFEYETLYIRQWDLLENLKTEWENKPGLLASLIMYVDSIPIDIRDRTGIPGLKMRKPLKPFEAQSRVLRDFKKYVGERAYYKKTCKLVEKYDALIESYRKKTEVQEGHKKKNEKKREAAKEVISELEAKYKKQKK